MLPRGRIACLCTPTLHERLIKIGFDSTLLEIDRRLLGVFGDTSIPFDLRGCSGRQIDPSLLHTFNTVVVDPPFDLIELSIVAERVRELLDYTAGYGRVILVNQLSRKPIIDRVFGDGLGLVPLPDLSKSITHESRRKISAPIEAFVFDVPTYW